MQALYFMFLGLVKIHVAELCFTFNAGRQQIMYKYNDIIIIYTFRTREVTHNVLHR